MLKAEAITARYGGVLALDRVSIEAPPGRVTGLIGPNGAGKTTLFNVVSGLQRPTAGSVTLAGRDVTRLGPRRRASLGLGRTFQRLEVFGSLTVRENVQLAAEVRHGWARSRRRVVSDMTDELLQRVGLASQGGDVAAGLPTGAARLLELARALATQPSVLLLDEPGSGLNEHETRDLGGLLSQIAHEGTAVLLVEHDFELVMGVCNHVYVLDFGQVLCEGSPTEIAADSRVQEAYLGAGVDGPPVAAAPSVEPARA